jgi:UDP-2,4-diacetamido-2,4,6-trideoxy-beta-L-altropyranose hydrolase
LRAVIRADASSAIGIGHLMRSFALAEALRDGNDEVTLVTAAAPDTLVARWERAGAVVRRITSQIGSAEDARESIGIAREVGATWVTLDGYAFDAAYRSAVGSDVRQLLVDDHGASRLRANLVVNGNLFASDAMYPSFQGRLLAGPRYALLRREFREPTTGASDGGIVLSLGGADPEQRTAPLLEALGAHGMRGRVVIGPSQRSPAALRARAEAHGWEAIDAPDDMSTLLGSAKMAIVGSGTTTLECAALGVPMVAVRIAENQARVAAALEEFGLAIVVDGADPEGAALAAARLAADAARRAAMAGSGPRVIDGRGALRVASAMREAILALRPATRDDARLLLDWRNDPETRAGSFATEPVAWDDHVAWLDRIIASADARLLLAELEGSPIGVVRFERRGHAATISLTVAPAARSRGLATPLIRAAMEAAADLAVERIEAYVRRGNVPSRRAFAAADFTEAARTPGGPEVRPDAVLMVASPVRRR